MLFTLAMNSQRIALVACVKEKKTERCEAKQMYVSSAFESWMRYADSWGATQVYILSGKYGILELDEAIDPYDFNLNIQSSQKRRLWAKEVIDSLGQKVSLKEDTFLVLSNSVYAEYLVPHLKHYSMPLKID